MFEYSDVSNPSLLLNWIVEHDYLDTCCLGCLIVVIRLSFTFLYLYLLSVIEHVSHENVIRKCYHSYYDYYYNMIL